MRTTTLPQYSPTGITDMKKAQNKNRLYLAMTLVGACIALTFTVAAVLLVYKFQYIPAIVFAVLSAYGYYSAPFCFFAFTDTRLIIKIIGILSEDANAGAEDISKKLGLKVSATEKLIKKAKRRGYIV